MPVITLPDGAQRNFPQPVTVSEVALSIGSVIARNALAARIDDRLCDLTTMIAQDSRLALISERDQDGVDLMRHSCAHLLAMAVKQLYPATQVAIGPTVEDGFYYDFSSERPFTPDDFAQIEARMRELIKEDIPLQRIEMPRDEAIRLFDEKRSAIKFGNTRWDAFPICSSLATGKRRNILLLFATPKVAILARCVWNKLARFYSKKQKHRRITECGFVTGNDVL